MRLQQPTSGGALATGVTLIEVMTVISIIGILAAIATPSFIEIKRNSELKSASNTLVAALNNARFEAMKRGMTVIIVPTQGFDWAAGVTIFVDKNLDNALNIGEEVIATTAALPTYFSVKQTNAAGTNYVYFNGAGFARTLGGINFNAVIEIARSDIAVPAEQLAQTRRIKVAATGRVRSCRPLSALDQGCLDSVASP